MRKMLLIFSLFAACNSSNNFDVIGLAENHLKENMKDPSSYQRVEARVVDTTTQKEYWQRELDKDTEELNAILSGDSSESSYQTRVKYQKDYIELDKKRLSEIGEDAPYSYSVFFKYRAKNGFGALNMGSNVVNVLMKDTSFVIKK